MSTPNAGEVNTGMIVEGTHCLNGHEVEDSNSAAASTNVPNTSEELARQIKTASDPSTK